MRKSRQHAFTLVELISVLVILAILLSIALPAVTNLTKANALNAAAREVSNTLSLARQMAITHRVRTRVVFPFTLTTTVSTLAPAYLSYAVMTNDVNTGNWSYVTKWEQLPTGAVFLKGPPNLVGSLDYLYNQNPLSMPFPYANSLPAAPLACIEFGPTGAASLTSTFTLESGFIDNNGNLQRTAPYNSVTNVVDNIVGHIQVIHP
jgi:prepilin-type N-terminal cleavage/methylation domain-containing protein